MTTHKSLSLATVLEKNKVASAIPFLLALDIYVVDPATGADVETVHIIKNTENLTWNSILYTAAEFDVDLKEEAGSQPEITLTMIDYTKAMMAKMDNYGGGVGFRVTVSVVRADTATIATDKPEVQFFFEVIGASASEYAARFMLGAENALMKKFPRRIQVKNFCAWKYKDPTTCRYVGALPSCDLTLKGANGCSNHANEVNYGAFPGINNSGSRYT